MIDENNEISFGDFVRTKRLELNIGLRKFASIVGLSPTFISKMEVNEFAPPKEDNIIKIAEALNVDKDMLLGMAGKVATDVQQRIQTNPELFATFLRKVNAKKLEEKWDEINRILSEEEDDQN